MELPPQFRKWPKMLPRSSHGLRNQNMMLARNGGIGNFVLVFYYLFFKNLAFTSVLCSPVLVLCLFMANVSSGIFTKLRRFHTPIVLRFLNPLVATINYLWCCSIRARKEMLIEINVCLTVQFFLNLLIYCRIACNFPL